MRMLKLLPAAVALVLVLVAGPIVADTFRDNGTAGPSIEQPAPDAAAGVGAGLKSLAPDVDPYVKASGPEGDDAGLVGGREPRVGTEDATQDRAAAGLTS